MIEDDADQLGSNRFLIVWDMYGLESAINLDGCISKRVHAALLGEKHGMPHPGQLIEKSLLRARFNTHRNYEIYAIALPSDTTEDDVTEWFDLNPQGMADLIRKKGVSLHRDSSNAKPVIY